MLDLLIILVLVVLIFGSKRLRTIGSDLGSAVRGFRKGVARGSSAKQSERVESHLPDAEFPEVETAKRPDRDGA